MKKLLSYLFPIKLNSYETLSSGTVAVTLLNGKKILDTAISNYSYGSLQRILYKALKRIPFDHTYKNILVLGMGAGSVVQTIRENFQSDAHLTLVEIDEVIISIAEKEFGLSKFSNTRIIHADAFEFIKNNNTTFDLVIVDLFIIDTIPEIFTTSAFIAPLCKSLHPGSTLVFNTMRDTLSRTGFNGIIKELADQGVQTRIIKKLEGSNDIIIGKKQ